MARALRPAQIRQIRAGVVITGRQALISRVHLPVSLAGPGSSGSTNPSRRCRGCLPLDSASPEPNCPQLQPDCYDNPVVKVSHLTRFHGASWRTHPLRQDRRVLPSSRHPGIAADVGVTFDDNSSAQSRKLDRPRFELSLVLLAMTLAEGVTTLKSAPTHQG
jgi:hypothetical protein